MTKAIKPVGNTVLSFTLSIAKKVHDFRQKMELTTTDWAQRYRLSTGKRTLTEAKAVAAVLAGELFEWLQKHRKDGKILYCPTPDGRTYVESQWKAPQRLYKRAGVRHIGFPCVQAFVCCEASGARCKLLPGEGIIGAFERNGD